MSYYGGGRIFFAESIDTFVQDLQRATPTFFISVPRLWLKFQLGVFKKMPPERLDFLLKIPIVNNIIRKKSIEEIETHIFTLKAHPRVDLFHGQAEAGDETAPEGAP